MLPRRLAVPLAVLLLIIGTVRIGWIVGHQPLLGYANQFDTGRTSACFGLWPNLPEPARYEAHRESPIAHYIEGERRPAECYVSSELLFTGVAIGVWKLAARAGIATASTMDLRFVGAVKAIALLLLALVFTRALRDRPAWIVANAAVFAVVLADPFVTLWMNTLYTEYAAVLFAYAALSCLAVIVGSAAARGGWHAGFGVALLGLGLSRQQHAFLPLFLVLLAWPAIRQRRRLALPLIVAACAAIVVQTVVITRPPSIAAANNVNVVLGTLLPAARDQPRALRDLGLESDCASVIGATWYVTMGENIAQRCPGVLELSRLRTLGLLAAEPMLAVRALLKAAPLSQPALLRYIGIDESSSYTSLDAQRSVFDSSIASAIERLPVAVYLGVLMCALSAFFVSLAAWIPAMLRRQPTAPAVALTAALGGIVAYAIVTSVFGDGLVEFARHAHLGSVALYAMIILGVVVFAIRAVSLIGRPAPLTSAARCPAPSWYFPALLAAIAAVAFASPLWITEWKAQPLAIGVVDEPESNALKSPTVTLHGWTMDPFGPSRAVTIVDDQKRFDGHPWSHPTDPAGAALARAFPTYQDPTRARFETVIDTTRFAGSRITLRTYAQTEGGILTEIDRRTLVRAAQ